MQKLVRLLALLPTSWTKWLVQIQALVRNPYIVGVRVIVENEQGHVLLVRHSYIPDWYLPGGGVNRGETVFEAAMREVHEEAGIQATTKPTLLHIFLNEEATGRDHVCLFYLKNWTRTEQFLTPNAEVLEASFFSLDSLPDHVSKASARRLHEFRAGKAYLEDRW